MTDFIATLGPKRANNWQICKRAGLWGAGGDGSNWRKNALRLRTGDRVFVWRSGKPNGFIAHIEALGPFQFIGTPGVVVPWPDPEWFGGVFPMRVVAELDPPVGDVFPNANGRFSPRFGFNNTALQHCFEELRPDIARRIEAIFSTVPATLACGIPYAAPEPPSPVSPAEPFDTDPDVVDRGRLAHYQTIEALASWVRSKGLEPLGPAIGEPLFDLAWQSGKVLNVAEIKSITAHNEESQLRLGLGQVLRYRHQLGGKAPKVRAWLVVERKPSDLSWVAVCSSVGVRLAWLDDRGSICQAVSTSHPGANVDT